MFETIVTLMSSGGMSAIVGGVMGYLNRKEDRKQLEQEQDHVRKMAEFNLQKEITLADKGIERSLVEGEMAENEQASKAFARSMRSSSKFSEILKSVIRPFVLGAYTYQTYIVFTTLTALAGGVAAFELEFIQDLFRIVVLMIVNMAALAGAWYFAQRPSRQFNQAIGELYNGKK